MTTEKDLEIQRLKERVETLELQKRVNDLEENARLNTKPKEEEEDPNILLLICAGILGLSGWPK